MISKTILFDLLKAQLESDLQTNLRAADMAHKAATDSESKAETQYDTLGLEASYLAHGQSMRAHELQNALSRLELIAEQSQNTLDTVDLFHLVTLEDESEKQKYYFICPVAGGYKLEQNNHQINVLSPESPLGELLLGGQKDDEISLNIGSRQQTFYIVDIQ